MKLGAAMPFVVAGPADWAHNTSSDLLHDWLCRSAFSQIAPMPRAPDMKIPPLPFTATDWSTVAATVHPGETGVAIWRTFTIGDLRGSAGARGGS
jgi:hypothetical protein